MKLFDAMQWVVVALVAVWFVVWVAVVFSACGGRGGSSCPPKSPAAPSSATSSPPTSGSSPSCEARR